MLSMQTSKCLARQATRKEETSNGEDEAESREHIASTKAHQLTNKTIKPIGKATNISLDQKQKLDLRD